MTQKYEKDNKLLKYRYLILVPVVFISMWLLHISDIFYEHKLMEDSDEWLKPLYTSIGIPLIIGIVIHRFNLLGKKTNKL